MTGQSQQDGANAAGADGREHGNQAVPGTAEPGEQSVSETGGEGPAEQDQPISAWSSRRELLQNSPAFLLGAGAQTGGSVVGGDQHGVSGGQVTGDVLLGGAKFEYHFGWDSGEKASAELPAAEVTALTAHFVIPRATVTDPPGGADHPDPFPSALEQLRRSRVVVLSGSAGTGRTTAALRLLQEAGATRFRVLSPTLSPGRISSEIDEGCGYLLDDYRTGSDRPLRDHHLRAAGERLRATGGHLVIVCGSHPVLLDGATGTPWRAPAARDLLSAYLRSAADRGGLGDHDEAGLLDLPEVEEILSQERPAREVAQFAAQVVACARGRLTREQLGRFGQSAVERQIREWFDAADSELHSKAFLLALAAFHEGPYPLTVELSDQLYVRLQRIADPRVPACIPVFGTSSAERLDFARARTYEEPEETEWGPVPQTKVQFRDPDLPIGLLRESWLGHPSSRPALLAWLRTLADDPRPFVRTRAASTAAVLLATDLPSGMALIVRPWAADPLFRRRSVAAAALALAHHLGAPHVPRILRGWSADEDHRLRWTATRTYASVGESFPQDAVESLVASARRLAARGGPDRGYPDELDELAQSASALMLAQLQLADSGHRESAPLWSTLAELLQDRTTREFVLRTVLHASAVTDGPDGQGRPLLVDFHAHAERTAGTCGALLRQSQAALLRAALNDSWSTTAALENVRAWVRRAEDDPGVEEALAGLLPALVVSAEDRKRLVYLLENVRSAPGDQVVNAALRLAAELVAPVPTG